MALMSNSLPRMSLFRLSLREMLVLMALVAFAIGSLKYASELWLAIVLAVTMMIFFGTVILAAVDRGHRQAFAIGVALTMVAYGLMLMTGRWWAPGFARTLDGTNMTNIEFDQWSGRLPSSVLLRYVRNALDASFEQTPAGKQVPVKPSALAIGLSQNAFVEMPPREFFMPIGHCWWALLLGCVGGYFGRYVYWRRVREEIPR